MGSPRVAGATRVALLDGGFMSLRRLTPEDAEAVLRFHQDLTDRDRYFRFFTNRPAHLDQLVDDLTAPGDRSYAIGAFDAGRLIGVANYAVADDPAVAEMAVAVAHGDHLRGVGTGLLKDLARHARARGIRHFRADIRADNGLMLKVLSDLGWLRRRLATGPILRLEIELPDGDEP